MELLNDLAQEFAESTARIVGFDVVLTDRGGCIIGSSCRERLGGWLFEAQEVVRSREKRVISPEDAQRLVHTRPGVSYPLMDSWGNVMGVVAITGLPEEVMPFAPLVKTYAELFMRERMLLGESLALETDLQGVFRALMSDKFSPEVLPWLNRKARFVGLNTQSGCIALALKIYRPEKEFLSAETASGSLQTWSVLQAIRECLQRGRDFAVSLDTERYGILLTQEGGGSDNWKESVVEEMESVRSSLTGMGLRVLCAAGKPCRGLDAIGRSLREAFTVLEMADACGGSESLLWVEENRLRLLLFSLPRDEREAFVEEELKNLQQLPYGSDLKETLMVWMESGFSYRRAARALSIHRNTLHYRLDKVKDILGRDPRNPREMVTLYLALCMPVKI